MMKYKKILLLVFSIVLVSCKNDNAQVVEVTRIVKETVVSTQLVSISDVSTLEPEEILEDELVVIEALNQGAIVLVQYYTLLDYGLFEEAYQLLSLNQQEPQSLEKYIEMMSMSFVNVDVISVQPYGDRPIDDDSDRILYHVQIVAEGEGGMSGSIPNGVLQNLYITVINENSEWKIHSFATIPTR